MSNQAAIDSMVFESFMKGAETVILERKAILQPMTSSSSSDCAEYIRQTVNSWKRQLSRPMNIDLYIFNNATNGHVLMERWNFTYTNSPDSSELGSTATINQRIQTLLRGLYSFLRLLPGFNLLRCSPVKPLITVQIYDPKISPEAFRYESSNYNFPTISTSKGQLSLSVAFTNPAIVKDILRTINGGSLVGLPHSSSTRPEKGDSRVHSASIPIPGRTPPQDPYRARVFSDSKENQPRRSFKDESGLTAALRGEVRAMEARGEPTGVYMSPAPGTSGPSRQGGMLHPGSFGSGGDILFGTSPSSFSGRGLFYPQASSLPTASSFQQGSTPPAFGYMTNYDGGSSNSFDLPRPSPPYYPISSSLNSTSPHLGPSQLTTIMDRRQSWRKSSNSATLTQLSTSHRTEVLMAAVEQEVSRMKVSLPPSPFLALSSSSSSSSKPSAGAGSGSDSSKVQTTAENATQSGKASGSSASVTTMNIGDIENIENLPSIPATLPSRNSNNRLDIVMKYEKERERRNSEVYLYDSYPDSRSISISETTHDRDEDPLDAVLDDDAPFATYRPSFSSGNAVTPMYSVTAMTSASAAAVAPILAILNRGSTQKPGYSSGGLLGGTVDGLGGSGIPLPILTQELQRSVQDHKAFWQQYVASRNISLPSSAAPSVKAK